MRGTRDAATAQDAILAAAIHEFTAKGLAGARMDAIAAEAGVAKGLVFHHFGSKEALWHAALERIYAILRAGQDAAEIEALGPVDGMRRLAQSTFRLFRDHPEIVALMNEENLHRARHVKATPRIRALYNPLFATIGRLLEEGRRQGLFRKDVDVTALYVALSGLGYFYCANRWTLSSAFAGDLFNPERIAIYETMIADMIIAYLRMDSSLRRSSPSAAEPPLPKPSPSKRGTGAAQRRQGESRNGAARITSSKHR